MAEDLKPPPKLTQQIGSPIGVLSFGKPRRVFQGSEGWLLEENPALRRPQLWRTLKALRTKLPIISTFVHLFNGFVGKAKYSFKPVQDGDLASTETAERLLWGDLEANWPRILVKMAAYRLMGFSVCEWIAEPDKDGLWRLTDIVHLPQWSIHSMEMDKREKVTLFEQQVYGSIKAPMIPRAKTFYLVDDSTVESPYGRGVLSDVAEVGLELLNLTELEQRGNLSNLRRKPNILAPLADLMQQKANGNLSEEDFQKMIGPLREFTLGEDTGPDLNLILESATYPALREGGAVESPTAARVWETIYPQPVPTDLSGQAPIERKNNEIARMLGIEALLLGENSTGSFALAEVQAGLFYQTIDAVLRDVADELQRVLRILWVANEGRLHPEAEQHQAEKEIADQEKEDAKAERLAQINGDKGDDGKPADPLSKAIDDAEAVAVKPGDKGAAGPGKQGVPDPSKPMEPADYAAMAPEVQSDLSAYLSAGDLIELVQNIAGLGLTINPDSNMVRDILDRAGLDADGAFQGLEEQHADKMEEMEAQGFPPGNGPPDGEGGGGPPPPFGKSRSFVDMGRNKPVKKWIGGLRHANKTIQQIGRMAQKVNPRGTRIEGVYPGDAQAKKEIAILAASSNRQTARLADKDAGVPGSRLREAVERIDSGRIQHWGRVEWLKDHPDASVEVKRLAVKAIAAAGAAARQTHPLITTGQVAGRLRRNPPQAKPLNQAFAGLRDLLDK